MSKVLIVSRTKLHNGICVGGINLDNNSFVRLHTPSGAHLSCAEPYQIGEVWDLQLERPWHPRESPHVEDKRVISSSRVRSFPSEQLSEIIQCSRLPINEGSLEEVFDGKMRTTDAGKLFINKEAIPSNSVAFWIADSDLYPILRYNRTVFCYKDKFIPFVGFQQPEKIRQGTLVRLSLANWWKPQDEDVEERCYLQLSGWYN